MPLNSPSKVFLSVASDHDREEIYKIRHQVYAEELKQHATNFLHELRDSLDLHNQYIVAKRESKIIGFISVTSPAAEKYSVEKYFPRYFIPCKFDEYLYEIRLLTVVEAGRNGSLAFALMYAAFRWVQAHGGKYIVSICRTTIIDMYVKAGLQPLGKQAVSGEVSYDLCIAEVKVLDQKVQQNRLHYQVLQQRIDWQLPFSFFAPSACYHGGSFFKAIGEDLQNLEEAENVINADVLDAWFPPSPKVLGLLQQHLSWLLQTSPPTHADGLIKIIAQSRGMNDNNILPGAGSSDLIFLAFSKLLNSNSKVLIIDPTYGEYVHVLENIVQCHVTRFTLDRANGFIIDTQSLLQEIKRGYDLIVLVNPNSPTGVYIPRNDMQQLLVRIPARTIVWLDETYIDYAGEQESLEQFACTRENVVICKSMSKFYALSGVRVAYLCSAPHLLEALRALMPPWAVSLPAQVAAITALKDNDYYLAKYAETRRLRRDLKAMLMKLGISEVIEGVANFLLFFLPADCSSGSFLDFCKERKLYLRDVSNMGISLGGHAIRIAVKDEATNVKMVMIIKHAMKVSRYSTGLMPPLLATIK